MTYQTPPPPQPSWQAVPLAPNGRPLASFADRLLAYLVDSLIFAAAVMVLFVPLMFVWFMLIIGEFTGAEQTGREPNPVLILGSYFGFIILMIFVTLVGTYVYYVEYQLRKNGQTLGKKVMNICVTPVNPGQPLTRRDLSLRWLVQVVAAQFIPLFSLLDGLWQLWDKPLQQCLHDKAAQTVVVKLG